MASPVCGRCDSILTPRFFRDGRPAPSSSQQVFNPEFAQAADIEVRLRQVSRVSLVRPEASGAKDLDSLEAEIASVDNELEKLGASHAVLDRNLQIISDTLDCPQELLAIRSVRLELDSMNIRADTSTSAKVHELELSEAYSGIGATRILLPGWFPVDELPPGRESIADAMRYL